VIKVGETPGRGRLIVELQDSKIYIEDRIEHLNRFSKDLENIFILHLSYMFYLKDHYMMSTDYLEDLEEGITPEADSQYWVAPFIQVIFDEVIKNKRMDLATEIKNKTKMMLK
jgi:hypothetical protein